MELCGTWVKIVSPLLNNFHDWFESWLVESKAFERSIKIIFRTVLLSSLFVGFSSIVDNNVEYYYDSFWNQSTMMTIYHSCTYQLVYTLIFQQILTYVKEYWQVYSDPYLNYHFFKDWKNLFRYLPFVCYLNSFL